MAANWLSIWGVDFVFNFTLSAPFQFNSVIYTTLQHLHRGKNKNKYTEYGKKTSETSEKVKKNELELEQITSKIGSEYPLWQGLYKDRKNNKYHMCQKP